MKLPFLDGHPPKPEYRAVAKRRLVLMRKLYDPKIAWKCGHVFRQWGKYRIIERVAELEWETLVTI